MVFLASAWLLWRTVNAPRLMSPNDPWTYAGRVGADDALTLIKDAVEAYKRANNGALPVDANDASPFLKVPPNWRYRVRPEAMLPHVKVFVPSDGVVLQTTDRWSFVVAVYVLGAGPMQFNQTRVAAGADNGVGYEDAYKDADALAVFGPAHLRALQAKAYQLP
jgi:hypothetical protein